MNARDRRLPSPGQDLKTHLCALAATSKQKSFAIVLAAQASHPHCTLALLLAKSSFFFFAAFVLLFRFCIAFCVSACNRIHGAPQLRQTESAAPKTAQREKRQKQAVQSFSPPRDSVCDVSIDSSASCDSQPGVRLAQATRRSPKIQPVRPPANQLPATRVALHHPLQARNARGLSSSPASASPSPLAQHVIR